MPRKPLSIKPLISGLQGQTALSPMAERSVALGICGYLRHARPVRATALLPFTMLLPFQGVVVVMLIEPRVPLRSALGYVLAGLAARLPRLPQSHCAS